MAPAKRGDLVRGRAMPLAVHGVVLVVALAAMHDSTSLVAPVAPTPPPRRGGLAILSSRDKS